MRVLQRLTTSAIALACVGAVAGCGAASTTTNQAPASTAQSGAATQASAASQSSGQTTQSVNSQIEATAKRAVDAAMRLPAFTLTAPPVDAAKARGKSIFIIPISSSIPFIEGVSTQLQKEAEQLGIKATIFANQGTPTEWAQGVEQAIAQKANVIVLVSAPDPRLLIPQLKAAKAAGIKTIVAHFYQNGTQPPANVRSVIAATTTAPFSEAARLEMDTALSQTGAKTNVLIVTSYDIAPSAGIVAAMKSELQARCSSCKATVINVPTVDWATKIQPGVESALAKEPSINWVVPTYDSMSIYVAAGINAAGRSGKVRIVSYNGTTPILAMVQKGQVYADVGENLTWLAWSMLDQSLRLLTGMAPIANGNEDTPLRVFDSSNIAQVGTPPKPNLGYGNAYVSGYKKLWGLSK